MERCGATARRRGAHAPHRAAPGIGVGLHSGATVASQRRERGGVVVEVGGSGGATAAGGHPSGVGKLLKDWTGASSPSSSVLAKERLQEFTALVTAPNRGLCMKFGASPRHIRRRAMVRIQVTSVRSTGRAEMYR